MSRSPGLPAQRATLGFRGNERSTLKALRHGGLTGRDDGTPSEYGAAEHEPRVRRCASTLGLVILPRWGRVPRLPDALCTLRCASRNPPGPRPTIHLIPQRFRLRTHHTRVVPLRSTKPRVRDDVAPLGLLIKLLRSRCLGLLNSGPATNTESAIKDSSRRGPSWLATVSAFSLHSTAHDIFRRAECVGSRGDTVSRPRRWP